ncbi:MAG TPA: response regulator, partial [Archangium sp.]
LKTLSGSKERILLVEDEPLVRSSVKRLLQSLGYVVTVAGDGEEALRLLRNEPSAVDLVISDISMPRMSGLELTKTLLAEQPDAKIVLYTGFTDRLDEVTSNSLGIKKLLAKPISRDALSVAVREALGPAPAIVS